jgi:hypothetical protein
MQLALLLHILHEEPPLHILFEILHLVLIKEMPITIYKLSS